METNGYHCHVSLTNNRLSPSILNGEPRLKVGERYYVRRSDDVWHPARIVDIRPCSFDDENRFKYRVNYHGSDLDEWVLVDRFHFTLSPLHSDDVFIRKDSEETCEEGLEDKGPDVIVTKLIQFGNYEIDVWYSSKYPGKYHEVDKLYICEYCLKYMEEEKTLRYHMRQCVPRRPPGTKIYCKDSLSVYEVDGKVNKLYCQLLCLLSKLFLDQKTLFYDVDEFLFYVLTETDRVGSHLIGYFSKEKDSTEKNNLACIMTLPPYQRQGYGNFLISLSYELAKLDHLIGSPERPFSKFGLRSYIGYWSWVVLEFMKEKVDKNGFVGILNLNDISERTCIAVNDIRNAMVNLKCFYYWCGNTAFISAEFYQMILQGARVHGPQVPVDLTHLRYVPLKERLAFDFKM